jgi:hypothetical protein
MVYALNNMWMSCNKTAVDVDHFMHYATTQRTEGDMKSEEFYVLYINRDTQKGTLSSALF